MVDCFIFLKNYLLPTQSAEILANAYADDDIKLIVDTIKLEGDSKMRKNFFLLLFCFVFSSPAFATTQYYYLRPTGAGSNSGDSGTFAAVPTTDANAMSARNFNDPMNWSTSDSASKIDPDDVVYPKGTWDNQDYDLKPVYGVTLDFWENGDFDPVNGDHTAEPLFKWTKIFVRTNNVKIYDGRFGYMINGLPRSASTIINAAPTAPDAMKITGLEVKRNAFFGDYYTDNPSVYFGFVCDSEVVGNYFYGYHDWWSPISEDGCKRHSRFFLMHAGSRNKITHNRINGGYTAPVFLFKKDFNHDGAWDIPSSGSYAIDPDGNMEDNEIAYNYIERRCEEGISYDPGNDPAPIVTVERDTVKSISGNQITLNHSGWSSAGNKYSGFYMISVDDEDISFGRHALIQTQSNATFTFSDNVSTLFPGLTTGEYVSIALVFRHNWIHNNHFEGNEVYSECAYRGFPSSILFEGFSLENIIENNFMGEVNGDEGLLIRMRPLNGLPVSAGSITKTTGSTAAAFNIIRNNTCSRIQELVYFKNEGYASWPFINRNNAIYNNTLYDGVYLYKSRSYVDNNTGIVKLLDGDSGLLPSDPTAHVAQYFANWAWNNLPPYLYPPKNVKTDMIVSQK